MPSTKTWILFENDSGHETYIHGVCVCVMLLVRHSHSLSIAFVLLCLLPVWTPATNSKFGIDMNVLVMSDPKVRLHCWMVLPSAWKPTCECSQLICWNTFGLLLHSYCIRHALKSFTELGKEWMQQKSTYGSTWAVWGVIFYWIFTALCGPWQPALGVQPVQWWFFLGGFDGVTKVIFDRDTCWAQAARKVCLAKWLFWFSLPVWCYHISKFFSRLDCKNFIEFL